MSESWLTEHSALGTGIRKLAEAKKQNAEREATSTTSSEIARSLQAVHAARQRLRMSAFQYAVGIVWPDDPDDHETWFISTAQLGSYFADQQIVSWTHWIGSVATKLREGFERGNYPLTLAYGPEGRKKELPVGPLVQYLSSDGRLTGSNFLDASTILRTPAEPSIDDSDGDERWVDDGPGAGLHSIVTTFDVNQDDIVRGEKSGAFLYFGGPGTGKTTLALHRIPYLIHEQEPESDEDESEEELFFSQRKTLVVVWKEHLVTYLRDCISSLITSFPDENVAHIDKWVIDRLRPYVKFGGKSWGLSNAPDERVESLKSRLTEHHLSEFLRSNHELSVDAATVFAQTVPKSYSLLLQKKLDERRELLESPFAYPAPSFSVSSYERTAQYILDRMPETDANRFSEMQNAEIKNLREAIRDARKAAFSVLCKYDKLLFDFYSSEIVVNEMSPAERAMFLNAIQDQQANRRLTRRDTYQLIWLIFLITDSAKAKRDRVQPLPDYTHIIVDEAQYYEPILLRLFGRLVALPYGVLTIVGDLEQRFSHDGGVYDWKEVGIEFAPDRRVHLEANYRWTPELFDFLELYGRKARISEAVVRPYKFRVEGGQPPEVRRFPSVAHEHQSIADRLSELRAFENSGNWTYAIVLPDELVEEAQNELIPALEEQFIEAQWGQGNAVAPTVDRVTVTNYHSIVGLEFDCVFVIGVQLPPTAVEANRDLGLWVALTRAKKFLYISLRGASGFLDSAEFDRYRGIRLPDGNEVAAAEIAANRLEPINFTSLTPTDWFTLAAWANKNQCLNGWERQFCRSHGIRVRSQRSPSDRESAKAQEILNTAIAHGFAVE